MKPFVVILLCLTTMLSSEAADLYVNNSGQPDSYTTISAAIAAAAAGDRIFVSPFGEYTEDLTITQDVTLASAAAGTSFNVVGSLTITCTPNMNVRVIGGSFSNSITAQTGSATLNDMANVYIVECKFSATNGYDFVRMHVLFCDLSNNTIAIRHGEIRGNKNCGLVSINDGPNAGIGDTLFIVGNTLADNRYINWNNDDNYFWIANNRIDTEGRGLQIFKHHFNSVANNNIINNYIQGGDNYSTSYQSPMYLSTPSNLDNIYVYNNVIESASSNNGSYNRVIFVNSPYTGSIKLYYNYLRGYNNGATQNAAEKIVGNITRGTDDPLLLVDLDGRCTEATCIDKGSPALQYYDIDMTRNDIGSYGGPYSIDNYMVAGAGKARVYDLDMPFEIWSGQTPQVKAKAAHTK